MSAPETRRPKTRPLISRISALTAVFATLLTLGNIQNPQTAQAYPKTPSRICQIARTHLSNTNNIHGPSAGGTDVTPLSTEKLPNGDVTYRFQVSLSSLQSSGHIQTGNIFQIAMPPFAKDVKFSQYGTYKNLNNAYAYENSVILQNHVTTYVDEDAPGKPTVTAEMPLGVIKSTAANPWYKQLVETDKLRAKAIADYYQAHADRLRKEYDNPLPYNAEEEQKIDTNSFGQAVTLNGMKALREAGYKAIPGGIIYAGYNYNHFEGTVKTTEELAELENTHGSDPKVKSYLISTGNKAYPLGFHVEYTVPTDRVKKTPTMPLWASLAWRSFRANAIYAEDFPKGSQPLNYKANDEPVNDIGDTLTSFKAIADPATIQGNDFDKNGLYGTNLGITAYTGNWYTIGSDVTPGTFNFPTRYSFTVNPAVTYFAPMVEDYRDIAALNPDKQLPAGRPEARPLPSGRFLNCSASWNLISSGGGVDVSPILEPLAREPFPENAEGAEGAAASSPDRKTAETAEGSAEGAAEGTAEPKCVKPEDLSGTVETPETAETPEKAGTPEEETVHYSFLVSLQAIQSSGRIQTGNTFDIELPFAAKNIKFHQIGTYDTSNRSESGTYKDNLKTAHYTEFPLGIMKAKDTKEAYAMLAKKYEERAEILKKYYQAQGKTLSAKDALEQVKWFGMLANQEELTALKAAGVEKLPGGIFDAGTTLDLFTGVAHFEPYPREHDFNPTKHKKYADKAHGFLISVNNGGHPMAVRVDFDVPKKQAEKTPNMAVWAALAWRGFNEGLASHEAGSQSLYEYASTEQDYTYLANPQLINDDQFDKNGLYGTSTALNQYTGKWWEIGQDITQSSFRYSDAFNLGINTGVTYLVAPHDDYRDIAAMHYLQPAPAPEDEQPKLCPPEKPRPGGGEATPPTPNPGGGEVTPPTPTPAPKADEPSASPSPETPDNTGLPRTGVNLAFGGSLAAALLLAGVVLVGRRRKNLS